MIPIVTENELNTCLLAINDAYKKGDIHYTNEYSLEINKQLITFIFDRRMGRKGSWIPKTNIKVIYNENDDPKV